MPRPEIDVVAWKPSTNQLLIIECKSYLDSTGVRIEHLHGQENVENDKFKLFNREALRALVVTALVRQLRTEGLMIGTDPAAQFVLIAGKIYSDHEAKIRGLRERRHHHRHETPRAEPGAVAGDGRFVLQRSIDG